jgi:nucleotide-binding universal stress UspA family protein
MTEAPGHASGGRFAIRRILAAFGPATMSAGVLEGAVDVAGRLGAELETLFVEDIALLQWIELPFIRQVGLHGLAAIPLSQRELELQFRALAAEAQSRLAATAALQQLRWSFRVVRGQVMGEVIAAAAHADLLVLGSSSRPVAREALLEPSVRLLIGAVRAPVLLLRAAQPPRGPVHVVLEPEGEAEQLLEAAGALAAGYGDHSLITAWTPEAAAAGEAHHAFARTAPAVRVRRCSSPPGLETLIGAVAGGTLVLSATSGLLELQTWWHHFAGARCALLLVR